MPAPTLWTSLPRTWQSDPIDVALVAAIDSVLATLYAEQSVYPGIWNPATCDPRYLPHLARALGWELDITAPVLLQRKIVSLLTALYRVKGTQPGILAVLRLFLDVDARIRAAWADSWRLGQSHLGGPRVAAFTHGGETSIDLVSVRYVATGAEPFVPAPAHDLGFHQLTVTVNGVPWPEGTVGALTSRQFGDFSNTSIQFGAPLSPGDVVVTTSSALAFTPGGHTLSVSRNGVTLDESQWAESPGRITLLTQGVRYIASGTEASVTVPAYTQGRGQLTVTVNGVRLVLGTVGSLASGQYGESTPTSITFGTPLVAADEVIVRTSAPPTPLSASDTLVVRGTERRITRLAPSPDSDPATALTLIVEIPRPLTADERPLVTTLLAVMKPSKAICRIVEAGASHIRWRLGTDRLGHGSRLF